MQRYDGLAEFGVFRTFSQPFQPFRTVLAYWLPNDTLLHPLPLFSSQKGGRRVSIVIGARVFVDPILASNLTNCLA